MRLRAANRAFTTIASNISAIATEITFDDATGFPSTGPFVAVINDEIILFESRSGNVCTVATTGGTLGVDGRGYDGTAASPHTEGDTVANKITAAYINNLWDELSLNSTGGEVNGDLTVNGVLTVDSSGSTSANTITGDLDATGDVNVTGDVSIAGSLDVTGNLTVTVSSGSTAALDFGGATIDDAVLKSYAEKHVSVTPSTAGVLTLDLDEGNVFYATLTDAVDQLVISNASTEHTNSFTLEMLLNADYSTAFYFAWQDPYSVIAPSTGAAVSVSTADGSFNSTGLFGANVEPGDIITVTGYSTAADDNNDSWRVKSATTSKIIIGDGSSALVGSTGEVSVGITRRTDYFVDTDVPDAPEPYVPKVFTGYSKDANRWRIAEVGEF